jgi:Flp pilus assembly protein TadG
MLEIARNKLIGTMKRAARFGAVRRFLRHEEGSTAVEFGMIMLPFLALMFAIMQTALVFFAGQTLETAVADSARLIMTGQAQGQGLNATTFKNAVCARIYGMYNCQAGVYVNVQTASSFSGISITPPLDSHGNLVTTGFGYNAGGPGDIVLVELIYQWPISISLLGLNLSNMAGNNRLVMATAAFRNEPYN